MIRQDCGLHAICDYIWPGRAVGCTPFAARALLPVARSQENCPSPSLPGYLWERLWILGGQHFLHPLLRTPLGPMALLNTAGNIQYLSRLKPKKIFERVFESSSMI